MNKLFTLTVGSLLSVSSFAQNDVPFDATDTWIAYMNIFNLGGGYEFGSPWALPDVKSTLDVPGNTITLQPNFNLYAANPTDPYWVDQTTGEGAKVCEALTFVEPVGFNGSDLTFHGDVLSSTWNQTEFDAVFFIKALDPNNGYADALNGSKIFVLPLSGPFTVSATGAELASGLIIQYGFAITGANANPSDEATLGSIVVGIDDAGINDLNAIHATLYPNPTNDQLFISSDVAISHFAILNLAGQVVLTGEGSIVDLSTLEAGVYVVNVSSNEGTATRRFVKQ